jgi:hypothetical protein
MSTNCRLGGAGHGTARRGRGKANMQQTSSSGRKFILGWMGGIFVGGDDSCKDMTDDSVVESGHMLTTMAKSWKATTIIRRKMV